MLSTKLLRSGTTSRLLQGATRARVLPTSSSILSNGSTRSISSERKEEFQELGYLDERGLTVFDTLHEMQVRSCTVFDENKLFGSYNEAENSYKYITYGEFDDKVNKCRAVLKDLGTSQSVTHFLYWIRKN